MSAMLELAELDSLIQSELEKSTSVMKSSSLKKSGFTRSAGSRPATAHSIGGGGGGGGGLHIPAATSFIPPPISAASQVPVEELESLELAMERAFSRELQAKTEVRLSKTSIERYHVSYFPRWLNRPCKLPLSKSRKRLRRHVEKLLRMCNVPVHVLMHWLTG